jgi:hypothetical protein
LLSQIPAIQREGTAALFYFISELIGGEGDDSLFGIDRHVEISQEVSTQ